MGHSRRNFKASKNASFVVINPGLITSVYSQTEKKDETKLSKNDVDTFYQTGNGSKLNKKRRYHEKITVLNETMNNANKIENSGHSKQSKKRKHAPSIVHDTDLGTNLSRTLFVDQMDQIISGLYWLLLSKKDKRSCMVVLHPDKFVKHHKRSSDQLDETSAMLSPVQLSDTKSLASILRHLNFQSLVVHEKMTKNQRKQTIARFIATCSTGNSSDVMILITTKHLASSIHVPESHHIDIIHISASHDININGQAKKNDFRLEYFVIVQTIVPKSAPISELSEANTGFPPLNRTILQQLQSRVTLAAQMTNISTRITKVKKANEDADEKWVNKLAKGSDLLNNEDEYENIKGNRSDDTEMTADEQRFGALRKKLLLLLAQNISTSGQQSNSNDKGRAAITKQFDEKLKILGIYQAPVGFGERLAAQTQWLDKALASEYSGEWSGSIRSGASRDSSSLALRKEIISDQKRNKRMVAWKANPGDGNQDVDQWGGLYGKACSHNEVVMHKLRPFYPQEVLNSRVCSTKHPAPGNLGFHGCLEHLLLSCRLHQRNMTLWDIEDILFLCSNGKILIRLEKRQFLSLPLSLAALTCFWNALRQWTIWQQGQSNPIRIIEGIVLVCQWANGAIPNLKFHNNDSIRRRISAFAIGGSQRLWKQISIINSKQLKIEKETIEL